MKIHECARLQSLDDLEHMPASKTRAFKALGNAVNADTIELVAERLLECDSINSDNLQRGRFDFGDTFPSG